MEVNKTKQGRAASSLVDIIIEVITELTRALAGSSAMIVPLLLATITSFLMGWVIYNHVLDFLPTAYGIRFMASVAGSIGFELYALMCFYIGIVSKQFNTSLEKGEVKFDERRGDLALAVYIVISMALLFFSHAAPDWIGYSIFLLPLLIWFGHSILAQNWAIREARAARLVRHQAAEDAKLQARKDEVELADDRHRRDTEAAAIEIKRMEAEAKIIEAQARQAEAEASRRKAVAMEQREKSKATKARADATKAKAELGLRMAQPPSPVAVAGNGHTPEKPREYHRYTYVQIAQELEAGTTPPPSMAGMATTKRYHTLVDIFGIGNDFTRSQALDHLDISPAQFLKDMKLVYWNRLVRIINEKKGIYRFVEPVAEEK